MCQGTHLTRNNEQDLENTNIGTVNNKILSADEHGFISVSLRLPLCRCLYTFYSTQSPGITDLLWPAANNGQYKERYTDCSGIAVTLPIALARWVVLGQDCCVVCAANFKNVIMYPTTGLTLTRTRSSNDLRPAKLPLRTTRSNNRPKHLVVKTTTTHSNITICVCVGRGGGGYLV